MSHEKVREALDAIAEGYCPLSIKPDDTERVLAWSQDTARSALHLLDAEEEREGNPSDRIAALEAKLEEARSQLANKCIEAKHLAAQLKDSNAGPPPEMGETLKRLRVLLDEVDARSIHDRNLLWGVLSALDAHRCIWRTGGDDKGVAS